MPRSKAVVVITPVLRPATGLHLLMRRPHRPRVKLPRSNPSGSRPRSFANGVPPEGVPMCTAASVARIPASAVAEQATVAEAAGAAAAVAADAAVEAATANTGFDFDFPVSLKPGPERLRASPGIFCAPELR